MNFTLELPSQTNGFEVSVDTGSSIILVGANGSGKTRLAAYIEQHFGEAAHRISAHRALTLNPNVPKVSGDLALKSLRYGWVDEKATLQHRDGQRWKSKSAVNMLSDYDFLLQALFADQSNVSLQTHKRVRAGVVSEASPTNFETLTGIWKRLLPHRELDVTGDSVNVKHNGMQSIYSAAEMSDGERAIFYLIGQGLTAAPNSLLIIDEPELHVHKSIASKLWDEIEAARSDCAYLFITHDLEFAASRACKKYVVREYIHPNKWEVEPVEDNTEFSEEICTLILGSRKPILFVEGDEGSLDRAIYRCCYPGWTIIPRGSCDEVIHSVVSMRRNNSLTRVACSGIVDADAHTEEEKATLQALGVSVLPVSEIENIFLLPSVSRAIAEMESYSDAEIQGKLDELSQKVINTLDTADKMDALAIRHCKRRIDRQLKKVDLSDASGIDELSAAYSLRTQQIEVVRLADDFKNKVITAKTNQDMAALMELYDNKGLLATAGAVLRKTRKQDFEGWITRSLSSSSDNKLKIAIQETLPTVS